MSASTVTVHSCGGCSETFVNKVALVQHLQVNPRHTRTYTPKWLKRPTRPVRGQSLKRATDTWPGRP